MNKLLRLSENGNITAGELTNANDLISQAEPERVELVIKGLEACQKTLLFPIGTYKIDCYSHTDSAGNKSSGSCTNDGTFICTYNCGTMKITNSCNLKSFLSVLLTFDNENFSPDLERFLRQQIEKAEEIEKVKALEEAEEAKDSEESNEGEKAEEAKPAEELKKVEETEKVKALEEAEEAKDAEAANEVEKAEEAKPAEELKKVEETEKVKAPEESEEAK